MNTNLRIKIILTIFLLLAVALAIGLAWRARTPRSPYDHKLSVGSQNLFVQVANTPQEMEQGLSDRVRMADNQAMLFKFGSAQMPTFWMKDMNFALDFIWIDEGKIISITPNAPAALIDQNGNFNDNNLPLYTPPSAVDEVLEVNAGWANKNHIEIGDRVSSLK
jgi:uncharacterized membrane protein (UPF0127 family)